MRRTLTIALAALAVLAGGALAVAGPPGGALSYKAEGNASHVGLRPTGVGLPQIGIGGTAGAGELDSKLRSYHDSGAYGRDLGTVAGSARAYLDRRLALNVAPSRRVRRCKRSYRRVRRHLKGRRYRKLRLYRRVKRCKRRRITPQRFTRR